MRLSRGWWLFFKVCCVFVLGLATVQRSVGKVGQRNTLLTERGMSGRKAPPLTNAIQHCQRKSPEYKDRRYTFLRGSAGEPPPSN